MAQFSEGVLVQYKNLIGRISFICDSSLSILIREFPNEPVRNVKIVVSRPEWKNIKLIKESDK
jgi:hypothetical protein